MNINDVIKLAEDGKTAEAKALMEELKVKAMNEPDEFIQEIGKPAVFKRRGKFVVQNKTGEWVLKNPSRRKK